MTGLGPIPGPWYAVRPRAGTLGRAFRHWPQKWISAAMKDGKGAMLPLAWMTFKSGVPGVVGKHSVRSPRPGCRAGVASASPALPNKARKPPGASTKWGYSNSGHERITAHTAATITVGASLR